MCYPKPGPRCSAHAAKELTKAWIECRQKSKLNSSTMSHEEFEVEAKRLIALREKAQDAYDATPAGMEILKREIFDNPNSNTLYKNRLKAAKATRNAQIKALKTLMQQRGETGRPQEKEHQQLSLDNVYQNYGLLTDFDSSNEDRIGWADSSEKFHKMHELLSRASEGWMKRLSAEQISTLDWYTSGESMALSIYKSAKRQGKKYEPKSWENYTEEELERRSQVLDSALALAPSLKSPVVLYRGIGSNVDFDMNEIISSKEYTSPHTLSASVNPGIANRFGYNNIILEIKTRKFPSPVNFSGAGTGEEEVMIPAGQKFRLVGIKKDITFGWSKEYPVTGYTVLQLEETEE